MRRAPRAGELPTLSDPLSDPLINDSTEAARKRKRHAMAKGQTACNPCRLRKVRCSFESPCQICVQREHPELCVYDRPLKRVSLEPLRHIVTHEPAPARLPVAAAQATPARRVDAPFVVSQQAWDDMAAKIDSVEHVLRALSRQMAHMLPSPTDHSDDIDISLADDGGSSDAIMPQGVHTSHLFTGDTIFMGSNSVPAMALALSKPDDTSPVWSLLDKSILPIFALDNESATYPFVDLWGLPHGSVERIQRLCGLLPADSDCFQYLRQYRDTTHVLFPAIINMKRFEGELTRFLATRSVQLSNANSPTPTEQDVHGQDVHWLGLLFACLASGCQCSDTPRRTRQLTSQVYVCCAYECLRIINYLSCARSTDIQNLLVLGNVISNSMNAGVAWALLGLTIRLAQGLGLHYAPQPETPASEAAERREVWARVVWQDSLLSLSYDRATPMTNTTTWAQPSAPDAAGLLYTDCMLKLCTVALEGVCGNTAAERTQWDPLRLEQRRSTILAVQGQARGHLQHLSECQSMTDLLEHWNWRMHCSYVVSVLYRPSLTKRSRLDQATASLRSVCIDALTDTVDAYLHLCNLTAFARSSWAAVHRSLSSALLLGILKEPKRNERVKTLLEKLIVVLSSVEYADVSEVPGPITRAVAALQRLTVVEGEFSVHQGNYGSTMASSENESPHAQMQSILWGTAGQDPLL